MIGKFCREIRVPHRMCEARQCTKKLLHIIKDSQQKQNKLGTASTRDNSGIITVLLVLVLVLLQQ
jgi:hypothetical protein